eukprot:ANDGO_07555.mRNA.1 TIP41-like protein
MKTYAPEYKDDDRIDIGNWSVLTRRHSPIASIPQREAIEHLVKSPCLPEMLFSENHVRLVHRASGLGIALTAAGSLCTCAKESTLEVPSARVWKNAHKDELTTLKKFSPIDWTFTPVRYSGEFICNGVEDDPSIVAPGDEQYAKLGFRPAPPEGFDVSLLTRPDPILFYHEVVLFESDLEDCGIAYLKARMRVMPSCFLILLRYFLRVDGLLLRCHDTRFFGRLEDHFVYREVQLREMPVTAETNTCIDPQPFLEKMQLIFSERGFVDFQKQ